MLETPILSIEPSMAFLVKVSKFFDHFFDWINMSQFRSLVIAVWTSHRIWVSIGESPLAAEPN